MDENIQLLMQGGSTAILMYLVWWFTTRGAPSFVDSMIGIKTSLQSIKQAVEQNKLAVDANTLKLDQLERTKDRLVNVVEQMARETSEISKETLAYLRRDAEATERLAEKLQEQGRPT